MPAAFCPFCLICINRASRLSLRSCDSPAPLASSLAAIASLAARALAALPRSLRGEPITAGWRYMMPCLGDGACPLRCLKRDFSAPITCRRLEGIPARRARLPARETSLAARMGPARRERLGARVWTAEETCPYRDRRDSRRSIMAPASRPVLLSSFSPSARLLPCTISWRCSLDHS